MVFESSSRATRRQIPKTQSLVPRTGQRIVTVGREDDVADEVRMAIQTFLRDTVVGFVARQFPHNQSLVWNGGGRDVETE